MLPKRPTCKQARRHRRARRVPLWKRTYKQLSPVEQSIRGKALDALSLVRREKLSLRRASKQVGLESQTVREHTNAFRRVHGRWKAEACDRIPRVMRIYEKGRSVLVEFADSRIASLIGAYHNQVKKFLNTGRSSFLKEFQNTKFKDIKGKTHTLETRPKVVFRIKQREAHPESYQIYKS